MNPPEINVDRVSRVTTCLKCSRGRPFERVKFSVCGANICYECCAALSMDKRCLCGANWFTCDEVGDITFFKKFIYELQQSQRDYEHQVQQLERERDYLKKSLSEEIERNKAISPAEAARAAIEEDDTRPRKKIRTEPAPPSPAYTYSPLLPAAYAPVAGGPSMPPIDLAGDDDDVPSVLSAI
jgi:hypothetical protein